MKKNDFVQIKGLDIKELLLKAKGLKLEVADLLIDKNMNKMKDLRMISKKRKDIAQILTVLRQKELLNKLENEASKMADTLKKKEAVKDNSAIESKSKKKGRTKLSKQK